MCWSCGCMMPEDQMGNPDNITSETIRKAARAAGHDNIDDVFATMVKTYEAKVKGTKAAKEPVS